MNGRGDFAPESWQPTADYYIAGGHDIRDVIEAFGLNYNRGAVVKYIARAGRKPGNDALLDLLKAREHIDREIARLSQRPEPAPPHQAVPHEAVCPAHPHSTVRYADGSATYCSVAGCSWSWSRPKSPVQHHTV